MAGTYYSYAERNASDEINWSQVGKNLTDMLGKEAQVREEKKAAIDKATREYGETLANAPQGEHQGINQWALTYADSAQQARLMQDRLLKSGQLKQRDYLVMRQNITDGTSQAFNLIKEYQAEYNDKMERYKNGDAQALEQFLMEEAEGFANFNNSELYINPTDFTVNVAKKEKQIVDGKEVYVMSKNPNDFTTVNAMRNRIKGKFDRLDVAKTLQAGVSTLGKEKDAIIKLGTLTQGGSITEIIDITKRKDFGVEAKETVSLYQRAENTYLDSVMVQPTNISSILTDYVGMDPETKQSYSYTWDAKKAGGSVILLKNDSAGRPVPEFTDGQKEVAKNALREKFRIMLDREVEIKATPQTQAQYAPQYIYERGDKTKELKQQGNMIAKLYSGTPAEQQSAVTYFMGLPGVRSVTRDDNGVVITRTDGTTKPIPFINAATKELMTQDDFVRSASSGLLGEKTDINEILKGAVGTGSKTFKSGTASAEAESNNPNEMYANYVSSSITEVPKDETAAVTALSPVLSRLGFTVEEAVPGSDYIVIKNKDGVSSSEIELSDPKAAETIQSFLLGNVPGKEEADRVMYLSGLAKKGVFNVNKTTSKPTPKVVNPKGVGSKY